MQLTLIAALAPLQNMKVDSGLGLGAGRGQVGGNKAHAISKRCDNN